MKNYMLSLLLLFVSISLFAEELEESEKHEKKIGHELSVNGTFFVKQFLNFSNTSIEVSPYLLYYKLIAKEKNALRFGFGMNYSSENDPVEGSEDNNFSRGIDIDYRLGWEHRFKLGKKWLVFAGVDLINSIEQNDSKTVSERNPPNLNVVTYLTDQTIGIGAGPVLGIQLKISERISLFTETSFVFRNDFIKSEVRRENSPLEDELDKKTQTSIQFLIPTSLFCAIKF